MPNEIKTLHELFESGLEYYHLRKPHMDFEGYCAYLNQIDAQYHKRVVVHQYHELVNEYNLKGIHFREQERRKYIDNPGHYFKGLEMFGKTISSSFHEPQELVDCYFEFDYHFLSPVFTSISKEGYEGRGFDVNGIDKLIVGMGGITQENIAKTMELGYKGVGLLGGVWNAENPVESFKVIQAQIELVNQK